jgi:membrane protease subunit HflC
MSQPAQHDKWLSVGITIIGLCFFILLFMLSTLYTIQEGTKGITLRLGTLVIDPSTQIAKISLPGLHMKWPFIDSIQVFDTRLQTLDIQSARIVTKEKKDVIVDYYVKWKIQDLPQFFRATSGNQYKAETLLEQQSNTFLRAAFGRRTITDLVTSERDDVMSVLRDKAEKEANQLGIHVVDVRIKGIELPPNTSNAIYQRMRADMKKIANRHRADGQSEALSIKAKADATVTVTLAKALSQAAVLKADGDKTAATIYRETFSKNVDFYVFLKSLDAYRDSFSSKQSTFVLDMNSSFFNYFKSPQFSAVNKVE